MPSEDSPGEYEYEIPEDVTRLGIVVEGAKGGSAPGTFGDDSSGGGGGKVKGTYEVAGGTQQTVVIGVGGAGQPGDRAGLEPDTSALYLPRNRNGGSGGRSPVDPGDDGGDGQILTQGTNDDTRAPGGGGGGGASGLQIDTELIVAAGGGGGAGGAGGAYDPSASLAKGGPGGRGGGSVLDTEIGGAGGGPGEGKGDGDYATDGGDGSAGSVASDQTFDLESEGTSDRTDGFVAVRYLPPPPNLTVSSTGKTVQLTWNEVPYANGYRVLRGAGNQVADVSGSSYSEDVEPGNTYTYQVVAYNESGSTPSNEVVVEIPPPRIHVVGGDFILAKVYDGQQWVETQTKQFDGAMWRE